MSFRLKNISATYQCALQRIFSDMLYKNVECYVDDLVVKSKRKEDHLQHLRQVFEHLRRYQLKTNAMKSAFGLSIGRFFGFIVQSRGLKLINLRLPRNIHKLESLQRKFAYIWWFISNPAERCQPFSQLMKKDVPSKWDETWKKMLSIVLKDTCQILQFYKHHSWISSHSLYYY